MPRTLTPFLKTLLPIATSTFCVRSPGLPK